MEDLNAIKEELEDWKSAAKAEAFERRRSHEMIGKLESLIEEIRDLKIVEIEAICEKHGYVDEDTEE